jgi:hypothetical protein
MDENNKLNYEKEVADMEKLVEVLQALETTKETLSNEYYLESLKLAESEGYKGLEYLEKSLEKNIEVFQLSAEIDQKNIVLVELKKRVDKDVKTTDILAKEADEALPGKIKRAKELADDQRVPKDVRHKLKVAFVDAYQTRHKFGFKDDEMKAAFYKALIQIIEAAEHWTVGKK